MLKRARDDKIPFRRFWRRFNISVDKISTKYPDRNNDYLQYKAERECFPHYYKFDIFKLHLIWPGPNANNIVSVSPARTQGSAAATSMLPPRQARSPNRESHKESVADEPRRFHKPTEAEIDDLIANEGRESNNGTSRRRRRTSNTDDDEDMEDGRPAQRPRHWS